MPSQLLGIDIGSYSIKAALFSTTFKFFELTDLFESPPLQLENIDDEEKSVVIREAILRLLQDHNLQVQASVSAIPGNAVSTRTLTLPLPQKQIEKVLPFELESHIPFNIEDIIVDHHLIHGDKTHSIVLAAAIKKQTLAEHLALLKSAKLDPAFVTLDSLSLFNLVQLPLVNDLGTYAIVDMGHQKTSICIVSNQQVRYVRTLFTAGKSISETIAEQLDLTWEQAQEVKHAHSIIELESRPLQSKDLKRLSDAIRSSVDPLIREIMQTFQAYRAQYSHGEISSPAVERVYLCGGTSLIRNLPEYINNITQLEIKRMSLFSEGNAASERLGDRQPILAQAVSLGLRAASRGSKPGSVATLNFRKNEFAFAKDMSGIREKAIFFGSWIVGIFMLALIHQGIRYQNLSRQYSMIEKSILKGFNEIAPNETPKPKSASQAIKTLESKISGYEQQQAVLTAGLNNLTALDILKEVSTLISNNIPLDTQELSIDRNKITLRGNTDSLSSVDQIISGLKKNPEFSKIDKGDIRESSDGKKAFSLTITVGEEAQKKPTRSKP